jgi:hypothetical protein
MRKSGLLYLLALFPLLTPRLNAEDRSFSVVPKGNFTTGSQLFPFPNSSNPFDRASFIAIEDFFGVGLEVKYQIPETNIALGISADYIRTTTSFTKRPSLSLTIPVEDGYRVIPVEFTAYFLIPVSGPTWGVYMGGGMGAYFGNRIYRYANVEARSTDIGHGFGIHVLGGVSYRITEWFSVNAEMKFRDLQFRTSNAFAASETVFQNRVITLSQPGESRVHTDGMIFQIGTAFSF